MKNTLSVIVTRLTEGLVVVSCSAHLPNWPTFLQGCAMRLSYSQKRVPTVFTHRKKVERDRYGRFRQFVQRLGRGICNQPWHQTTQWWFPWGEGDWERGSQDEVMGEAAHQDYRSGSYIRQGEESQIFDGNEKTKTVKCWFNWKNCEDELTDTSSENLILEDGRQRPKQLLSLLAARTEYVISSYGKNR